MSKLILHLKETTQSSQSQPTHPTREGLKEGLFVDHFFGRRTRPIRNVSNRFVLWLWNVVWWRSG